MGVHIGFALTEQQVRSFPPNLLATYGGGENTKRRKQLVRQSAKTEPELESCDVGEADRLERLGSPSQGRIIYKETIDISASSLPPVSPPQSWLFSASSKLFLWLHAKVVF